MGWVLLIFLVFCVVLFKKFEELEVSIVDLMMVPKCSFPGDARRSQ
jgi:hypothetical protein